MRMYGQRRRNTLILLVAVVVVVVVVSIGWGIEIKKEIAERITPSYPSSPVKTYKTKLLPYVGQPAPAAQASGSGCAVSLSNSHYAVQVNGAGAGVHYNATPVALSQSSSAANLGLATSSSQTLHSIGGGSGNAYGGVGHKAGRKSNAQVAVGSGLSMPSVPLYAHNNKAYQAQDGMREKYGLEDIALNPEGRAVIYRKGDKPTGSDTPPVIQTPVGDALLPLLLMAIAAILWRRKQKRAPRPAIRETRNNHITKNHTNSMRPFNTLIVSLLVLCALGVQGVYASNELKSNTTITAPTDYRPGQTANIYTFASNGTKCTDSLDTYYLFDKNGNPYFDYVYVGNDIYELGFVLNNAFINTNVTLNNNKELSVQAGEAVNGFTRYGRRPKTEINGQTGADARNQYYSILGISAGIKPTIEQFNDSRVFTDRATDNVSDIANGIQYTWSTAPINNYFGYYKIKRVRTFNATVVIDANPQPVDGTCCGKVFKKCYYNYQHGYDMAKDNFMVTIDTEQADEVKYYMVDAEVTTEADVYQKPENIIFTPPSTAFGAKIYGAIEQGAHMFEYTVDPNGEVAHSRSWENKNSWCKNPINGGNATMDETETIQTTIAVTDYVYVWARVNTTTNTIDTVGLATFVPDDENPIYLPTAQIDVNDMTGDNTYISSSKAGGQSYVPYINDYGLVPVRQFSHNVIFTEKQGVLHDWITVTEYDNANSTPTRTPRSATNGSTCGDAAYDRYDGTYPANGMPDEISLLPSGSGEVGKSGDMWVYQKSGKTYIPKSTSGKSVQGLQSGKKIYIAGSALNLATAGTGWMQLVETDVYLDNAKLQCAPLTGVKKTLSRSLVYDDNNKGDLTYKDSTGVLDYSASVFYIPAKNEENTIINELPSLSAENNTVHIHLKDSSYLAGQEAGQMHVKVDLTATVDVPIIGGKTMYVKYYLKPYRHSPPIEIKDEHYYYAWKKGSGWAADDNKTWRQQRDYVTKPDNALPQIYCTFDNIWADNTNLLYSYLDLSSQLSNKLDENDDASISKHPNFYTTTQGIVDKQYRSYTPPLYTGGSHGHYVINGGQINLWPAAVYMPPWKFHYKYDGDNLKLEATLKNAAPYSNYLVCGYQQLSLVVTIANLDYNGTYRGALGPLIKNTIGGILSNASAGLQVNGIGVGQPKGSLEINGGTITMNTDPNSFANYGGQGLQSNIGAISGVMLTPKNTVINGGSFPGYNLQTTKMHEIANGVNNAVPNDATHRGVPVNSHKKQNLTRVIVNTGTILPGDNDFTLPNHDYTAYDFSMLERDELGARALLINRQGTGDVEPYYYGMRSVVTTADKTVVMYLPSGATKEWVQNFTLGEGKLYGDEPEPRKEYMSGKHIYHLNIPDTGYLAEGASYNYTVARVNYKKSLIGAVVDKYYALSFPYQVVEVQDGGDILEGSWVENDVRDASWSNDDAWYWRYFLGKTAGNKEVTDNYTWIRDEFNRGSSDRHIFADEYTTHATGDQFEVNRPYLMHFNGSGWDGDVIEYRSADNTTALREGGLVPSGSFAKPSGSLQTTIGEPSSSLQAKIGDYTSAEGEIYVFQLAANNTLCKVPVTWKCYVINPAIFGDDDFHLLNYNNQKGYYRDKKTGQVKQYELYPFEAYLLGSEKSTATFKSVGKHTVINDEYDPNVTNISNVSTAGNLLAYGLTGEMRIWLNGEEGSAAQNVAVYSITGELVYQTTLSAGQMLSVPATTGVYIVRANGNAVKLIVR